MRTLFEDDDNKLKNSFGDDESSLGCDLLPGFTFSDEDAPKTKNKKRVRRTKEEMAKENVQIYVEKEDLYRDIVQWLLHVEIHNTKYKDIIEEYKETIRVLEPRLKPSDLHQKSVLSATRAGAIPREPIMPDTIGKAIVMICEQYASKANWRAYTWIDEMINDAVFDCTKSVKSYNTQLGNPFAYFTTAANYAFLGRLDKEKKNHQKKLDSMLDPELETYTNSSFQEVFVDTEDARSTYHRNK